VRAPASRAPNLCPSHPSELNAAPHKRLELSTKEKRFLRVADVCIKISVLVTVLHFLVQFLERLKSRSIGRINPESFAELEGCVFISLHTRICLAERHMEASIFGAEPKSAPEVKKLL
jgi:hypothetical protein